MRKKSKIYIIRNRVENPTDFSRFRINEIQKRFEEKGFEVVNPLEIYDKNTLEYDKATLFNLKQLLSSNAAYVMSDVSLKKGENTELKISLDINLIIIQDLNMNLDLIEFLNKKNTKVKT